MEETEYLVLIAHRGAKSGTKYQVGDKLLLEDFHQRLLSTNNQYHIPYVSKDIKSEKVAEDEFKKATAQSMVEEEVPEVVYTKEQLLSMTNSDIKLVLDNKGVSYKQSDAKDVLVDKYFE